MIAINSERKVILVTDGDKIAQKAVEAAVRKIGGRCISRSAGNPTPIDGDKIVDLVMVAKHDPVVIMVDDIGHPGKGKGEDALDVLLSHQDIKVIGIVAVASNTEGVDGINVDFSIDCNGKTVNNAVDKNGRETNEKILYGDTVDVINNYTIPIVVGIGDIGKMKGNDDCKKGAPILTKALTEILNRSEVWNDEEN